jgi:hypothetical protein
MNAVSPVSAANIVSTKASNRPAALAALTGAALLLVGSFTRWSKVTIDGVVIRELSQNGWDNGNGKLTVLVAVGAAAVGVLLLVGVAEMWMKVGLLVAAAVVLVAAVLQFLDFTSNGKPERIADTLGLDPSGIRSDAGGGLFIVGLAAVALAVAGLLVERRRPL